MYGNRKAPINLPRPAGKSFQADSRCRRPVRAVQVVFSSVWLFLHSGGLNVLVRDKMKENIFLGISGLWSLWVQVCSWWRWMWGINALTSPYLLFGSRTSCLRERDGSNPFEPPHKEHDGTLTLSLARQAPTSRRACWLPVRGTTWPSPRRCERTPCCSSSSSSSCRSSSSSTATSSSSAPSAPPTSQSCWFLFLWVSGILRMNNWIF